MVEKILKRNGKVDNFDPSKIENAIWKAVQSVGGEDREKTKYISNLVVKKIEDDIGSTGRIPQVEEVQDIVEKILMEEGHAKTAKAYILYRQSHEELRRVKGLFDTIEVVEDYLHGRDWAIKENANMDFSLQGLNNFISGKIVPKYWLRKIYPEKVRKAHENAEIHIHDLGTLGPYCVGWDLEDLLITGIKGVPGKVEAGPAKHLRTALGQVVNFFYTLQGESAGAQAFSNFDTLLAPFIKKDNLDYSEVKQCIQEFLFNVNVPTRVGFQTPFTNITMDLKVPAYLKDKPAIIGGEMQNEKYGDFQKEMDTINQAFADCMLKGDAAGRLFTFPIPTYNITKDFDWDNPDYDLLWEMTAKYGIPYFSNFINSDMKPEDARSMCCRLRLDQKELRKRGGGLFGSNPQTGSIGVVTINLPRIGYTCKDESSFFKRLEELMEISKESLEIKRKTVENFTDSGLYPYSKFYLKNVKARFGKYWENHFSTIGILGMNEAIMNFMPNENIATEKGRNFAIKVLDFMRDKLEVYQKETGKIYNLEATPGEGTTYRFASIDKKRFPKIITANEDAVKKGAAPYYTNSSQLPVHHTDDLFKALSLQDELQTKYTGGTVFHTFVGERLDKENVKMLVRKIAEKFKLPYFTITPTFSVCQEHGYLPGEQYSCPTCSNETEVYSRVVGYIRTKERMNKGKQSEFDDRKMFKPKIE
ncbi:MAG: ribonucleoside triphosphate reductase [Candidatus Nanoarchaeia archaeon]|nr:ribonucleoside triphosphate reductase [Candidatus Nanoarchaeia archaeon]MDD5357757.1 ribonucleoside triphosphate reductase [Candidatus Nanoarchaeia archaeon]MDD5588676.1 ribonucleoside triphosphate reductase [Candidatus Nanoarchaeia archaeon]